MRNDRHALGVGLGVWHPPQYLSHTLFLPSSFLLQLKKILPPHLQLACATGNRIHSSLILFDRCPTPIHSSIPLLWFPATIYESTSGSLRDFHLVRMSCWDMTKTEPHMGSTIPFSKKIKINYYYYYYLKIKHLGKYIFFKLCM